MNHDGLHVNRLDPRADNPREVAFARQWKEENENGHILKHLIPYVTQRDATVAATLMQWLGSNVGMCFLCDVVRDSPEVARMVRDRLPDTK
jgi:hypothetical protein